MLSLQQATYCNIVQLCVCKLSAVRACECVSGVQLDLTGPAPPCYVPRVRVSSQLNLFFSLKLRKVSLPHGDAPLTHQDFQLLALRKASPSCGRSLAYI